MFLDRDGILNEVLMRDGRPASPRTLEEFRLTPEAPAIVDAVHATGRLAVVVTNQPDIGRGLMEAAALEAMHNRLRNELRVDAIEHCPSGDDSDPRRKPNPGMLTDAAARLRIDLRASYFVGDGPRDVGAGRAAGVTTVLVHTGYNTAAHDSADINLPGLAEVPTWLRSLRPALPIPSQDHS